ncbi:MAG: c-type cytochrome [Nitrospinae bacterium]|nr:c-type cytochrome [Nitrospinota bacterium]MBL7019669.1 c-type cytochrome [Nitrospinaceae bacterium]
MKTWATLILSGLLLSTHASAGVLDEKGCGSCHRLNAEETENSFTAPALHYAGNKFQAEWLKQFLKNPEVIRPAGFITGPEFLQAKNLPPHPSFTEEDANALTENLMGLKISEPAAVASEPLSKGLRAKIKYQFERTFGCISCHQSLNLAGKIRGGISGPSLVNAGNRLQADWIADWLKSPGTYKVKGRMPRYKMDPTTLDQFTRFLMTLKKENIK